MRLSLNFNGYVQWVAVSGQDEQGVRSKEPWFGMVVGSNGHDADLMLNVIWLEDCDIRGKYYQLHKEQPYTQISGQTVIMYGIEIVPHLVRRTKQQVFRVKTSQTLIKKIWTATTRRKQQLFDEFVSPIHFEPADGVDHETNGVKQNLINTDLWASSAELAKSILDQARRLKLTYKHANLINK